MPKRTAATAANTIHTPSKRKNIEIANKSFMWIHLTKVERHQNSKKRKKRRTRTRWNRIRSGKPYYYCYYAEWETQMGESEMKERTRWSGVERNSIGALHKICCDMLLALQPLYLPINCVAKRLLYFALVCVTLSLFPSVGIRMPVFHFDFLRRRIEHPNSHNSNNNNHNFSFIIPLQSCRKISRHKFVSTESLC